MVNRISEEHVAPVAAIHAEAFRRQKDSEVWVRSTIAAFPRTLCFVLEIQNIVIGYIFWSQKSGIRPEVVLELEQIAIGESNRSKGYGAQLIQESLIEAKKILTSNNQRVKTVLVSTRADNQAQQLYSSVLGAKVEAVVSNLYSADEVFMVASVST